MKKLYLFRHGETDWNKDSRIQCSIDIELNEKGLEQARQNAEFLKDKGIQHIYASPLRRAYKTGEILAKLINVDIEIYDDLREMNGGRYEGMVKSDLKMDFGEENYEMFSHSRNEGMDLSFPDGETKRQVRNRIINAVVDIAKTTPYNIIGIASHGFVLRELLRGLDFEDDSGLKNCEVIEAEFDNGNLKIVRRICCENQ